MAAPVSDRAPAAQKEWEKKIETDSFYPNNEKENDFQFSKQQLLASLWTTTPHGLQSVPVFVLLPWVAVSIFSFSLWLIL